MTLWSPPWTTMIWQFTWQYSTQSPATMVRALSVHQRRWGNWLALSRACALRRRCCWRGVHPCPLLDGSFICLISDSLACSCDYTRPLFKNTNSQYRCRQTEGAKGCMEARLGMQGYHSHQQRSHFAHCKRPLTFALFEFWMRRCKGSRITTVAIGLTTSLFPGSENAGLPAFKGKKLTWTIFQYTPM